VIYCPQCGTARHDGLRYCATCKFDFERASAPEGTAAQQEPATAPAVAAQEPVPSPAPFAAVPGAVTATGPPLPAGGATEMPDGRPVRSSAVRANVASVMLGVVGVVLVVSAAHWLAGVGLMQNIYTTTDSELIAFDATSTTISIVYLVAYVIAAIAFLAWLSRAIDNVPRMGAGQPRIGPRWSIGWWFIPLANFVMPYRAVRDLDRRMRLPSGGRGAPVGWWWALWLGALIFGTFANLIPTEDVATATIFFQLSALADLVQLVAAVLAILVVRGIQHNAELRSALQPSELPFRAGDSSQATSAR